MVDGEQPGAQPDSRSIEDRVAAMMGHEPGIIDEERAEPQSDTHAGDDAARADDQATDDAPEGAEDGAEQSPGDLIEVEFDGQQYRVPQKMRDALLRHEDYTRKTQEVAERARMVEAYETQLQQQEAFTQATAPIQARLAEIRTQLDRFKTLDWANMDADTHLRMKHAREMLVEEMGEANNLLNGEAQRFSAHVAQIQKQMVERGVEYLKSAIPGWNAQRAQAVVQQAHKEGLDDAQVEVLNRMSHPLAPLMVKLLDKAARLDAIESKVGDAKARARQAPPMIKPGASDPAMSERMRNLNLRKQIKNAPTTKAKAALIEQRLERMFKG